MDILFVQQVVENLLYCTWHCITASTPQHSAITPYNAPKQIHTCLSEWGNARMETESMFFCVKSIERAAQHSAISQYKASKEVRVHARRPSWQAPAHVLLPISSYSYIMLSSRNERRNWNLLGLARPTKIIWMQDRYNRMLTKSLPGFAEDLMWNWIAPPTAT